MRKPLDSFKTLREKRLYRKLKQILNDPTHPMRHYFATTGVEDFLLPRTNTNRYKASFLPSALSVFNERFTFWFDTGIIPGNFGFAITKY